MSKTSDTLKPLLIVSHGFLPEFGGMEQFAGRLAIAMHQSGFKVEVVTTARILNTVDTRKSLLRPRKSMEYGFPLHSLGCLRKFWQIKGIGFLAAASYFLCLTLFVARHRKRFRGVIVFGILRDYAWLCLLKKIIPYLPIVGVESSCGILLEYRTVQSKYYLGPLYKSLIGKSNAKLVAFGDAILDEYRELKFDERRLIVIPNGITVSKTIYPYNSQANRIVKVGRLSHEKGFDVLLDAFASIKNGAVNLFIHGTGIELENLKSQVEKYNLKNRVVFHPSSKDVAIYDVFKDVLFGVIASRAEGMSTVQLEAMSLGIPMIVTDVGCNAEVFKMKRGVYGQDGYTAGDYGVLVPPENAKALSNAIEYLINDEKRRISISQNVRMLFLENYEISSVAKAYSNLFE